MKTVRARKRPATLEEFHRELDMARNYAVKLKDFWRLWVMISVVTVLLLIIGVNDGFPIALALLIIVGLVLIPLFVTEMTLRDAERRGVARKYICQSVEMICFR